MNSAASPRIRVLIVDDSPTNAAFLSAIFSADPALEVVGTVDDGYGALSAVKQLKPNIVTMDIHMPRLNGFDAAREIMERHPLPIVIVSGSSGQEDVANDFHALEAGALAMVARPQGPGHPEHASNVRSLIRMVKLMSEVKVVRRWRRRKSSSFPVNSVDSLAPSAPEIVAIGASTGGPLAIQSILSLLHPSLPFPVVIVQHMAAGFTDGFVEWLAKSTGFPVSMAVQGEALEPGRAYVAPDYLHLGVQSGNRVLLLDDPPEFGLKPSVSVLFRSVTNLYGSRAVGVLLTGMGRDGVDELGELRRLGGLTLVQNEETSVVFGMPGQAVLAGAARKILPPEGIALALNSLIQSP